MGKNTFQLFIDATWDEKMEAILHPLDAKKARKFAEKALVEAKKRFGNGSVHNGSGDAFRHCYWNAMMAREFGAKRALAFSTAHENGPGNPDAEKQMDLHNNKVGVQIGDSMKNSTDEELAVGVMQALCSGSLVLIKQDRKGFCSTKINTPGGANPTTPTPTPSQPTPKPSAPSPTMTGLT